MRFHKEINIEEIKNKIKEKFLGRIIQKPPVKSRVKREEREREIYLFELLEESPDKKDFLFRVKCQGGTYVRKLIDDLGKDLGIGAHMLELRRTNAGIFDEEFAINLYEFEKAVEEYERGDSNLLKEIIIPGEVISKVYPEAQIKEENLKQILTGKPIYKKDLLKDEGWKVNSIISVFCEKRFIGMYKVFRGKEIFAKPEFVMQRIE
jgi:H/ACA ribonucleoprotein complex subunit 4